MKATKNIRRFQLCAILSIAMNYGLPGISEGSETCVTNSSGPDICVYFDGDAPELDFDFRVDYTTDAANPSVTLLTGNIGWNVRSDDSGSPGNIGSILLDPTVLSNWFYVTIKNGFGPGAVNVENINLNAAGFTGWSSIGGWSISGNLTGGLLVVQDSGGNGGEVSLIIEGDVSGPVTIPVVNDFEIGGDLSANLIVLDAVTDSLVVFGDVASSATVVIYNFTGGGDAAFDPLNTGQFAGDLILSNGVPAGTTVNIGADILSTTQINLNDKAVAGSLSLRNDNAGTIVDGGAVTGTVELATGSGNAFSGSATFASVSSTGIVKTGSSASLSGDLSIEGDMAGELKTVSGGHVSGTIGITSDVSGDVDISGDLTPSGSVTIGGALASLVTAGIGRVMVTGACDGAIGVAEQSDRLTLTHCLGGLGSGATIEVNTTNGNFNAGGNIQIGPAVPPSPLNSITFDGCIHIYDEDITDNGGDLNARLAVIGCHGSPPDDLDICIDGSINGGVTLIQTGCSPVVDWSCDTCP